MLRDMGFSNLKAQAPRIGKTVELVLNQLTGDPIVVVEHLGETNVTYWNDAVAKAQAQNQAATSRNKKARIDPGVIKEARDANRATLVKHGIRDVKNFIHDDGSVATKDDIEAIVNALPDDVIDSIIKFVLDPNNFRDDAPIVGDPKALAGK